MNDDNIDDQGRGPPKVAPNSNDNLNFGWFSLPRDEQNPGLTQGGDDNTPRMSQGTYPQGCMAAAGDDHQGGCVRGSRPPSQNGSRFGLPNGNKPPSRCGRPGSNSGRESRRLSSSHGRRLPPSRSGWVNSAQPNYNINNDAPGNGPDRLEIGVAADSQMTAPEQQQLDETPRPPDTMFVQEVDVVDWPLSRAAQEMMRAAIPPAEPSWLVEEKQRCDVRSRQSDVPPTPATPLPPLHFNGYRGNARPTYASWREAWHRTHSQPPPCNRRQQRTPFTGLPDVHAFNNNRGRSNYYYNNK